MSPIWINSVVVSLGLCAGLPCLQPALAQQPPPPSPPPEDVAATPPTSEPSAPGEATGIFGQLEISVNFRYLFGGVSGYVQTPSGGEPGTTSHDRPTLDELGFNTISIYDASLAIQYQAHALLLGAQFVRLDGGATLASDLITQNTLFPAGTRETTNLQLDWYRIGYEYTFNFDLNEQGLKLRFAPGVQGVLLNFDYSMDAAGALHAHRAYAKGGVGVGGSIDLLTGGPFSVELSGFWGLPISNTAEISTVDLVGKYQLWGAERGWAGDLYLGIGYESIDYQDNQTVPNHINVNMGPLLVAGIEIRF